MVDSRGESKNLKKLQSTQKKVNHKKLFLTIFFFYTKIQRRRSQFYERDGNNYDEKFSSCA